MKKVLMVIPSLLQGGGQKFVLDLTKALDKQQFTVKILIYYDAIADLFKEEISNLDEVEIIKLNKKVGVDITFFKKVKKVVKEYDPDIIHTHLDTLLYLFPAFKKRQIKLHTVHTMARKEASGLQRLVRKIAFKLLKVKPIGISDIVAKSIEDCYKMKNVPVVYNGVVCKNYAGEKILHSGVNIITTGTLYEVKNHKYLIDCFYQLTHKHNDISLTILGNGPLREDLQKHVEKLGIPDKVFLAGEVADVRSYLLKADIFASTSLFEGLPLSMLEAMAAGLPIVANDVGGIPDIVKDGFNGYLVPLWEKDKYIEALDKMIYNAQQRELFAENAKKFVVNYDESKTVEGYEKLYQE